MLEADEEKGKKRRGERGEEDVADAEASTSFSAPIGYTSIAAWHGTAPRLPAPTHRRITSFFLEPAGKTMSPPSIASPSPCA
jgi:hypothetical protein